MIDHVETPDLLLSFGLSLVSRACDLLRSIWHLHETGWIDLIARSFDLSSVPNHPGEPFNVSSLQRGGLAETVRPLDKPNQIIGVVEPFGDKRTLTTFHPLLYCKY